MASFKAKVIENALCSKGFEKNNTHHRYFRLHHNGKKTGIKTKLSHGRKEYGDQLLGEMKRQLCFDTNKQLSQFIDCSITQKDYIKILKKKEKI